MIKTILLLGLGLCLIIAEVLVPSMGVLGILATCCVIGAIAWGFSMSTALGFQLLMAAAVLVPWVLVASSALGGPPLPPGATALVLASLVIVPLVWLVGSFDREPLAGSSRERDAAR